MLSRHGILLVVYAFEDIFPSLFNDKIPFSYQPLKIIVPKFVPKSQVSPYKSSKDFFLPNYSYKDTKFRDESGDMCFFGINFMKISLEGYYGGSLTRGTKLVVYMLIRSVVLNVGLMFYIFVSVDSKVSFCFGRDFYYKFLFWCTVGCLFCIHLTCVYYN